MDLVIIASVVLALVLAAAGGFFVISRQRKAVEGKHETGDTSEQPKTEEKANEEEASDAKKRRSGLSVADRAAGGPTVPATAEAEAASRSIASSGELVGAKDATPTADPGKKAVEKEAEGKAEVRQATAAVDGEEGQERREEKAEGAAGDVPRDEDAVADVKELVLAEGEQKEKQVGEQAVAEKVAEQEEGKAREEAGVEEQEIAGEREAAKEDAGVQVVGEENVKPESSEGGVQEEVEARKEAMEAYETKEEEEQAEVQTEVGEVKEKEEEEEEEGEEEKKEEEEKEDVVDEATEEQKDDVQHHEVEEEEDGQAITRDASLPQEKEAEEKGDDNLEENLTEKEELENEEEQEEEKHVEQEEVKKQVEAAQEEAEKAVVEEEAVAALVATAVQQEDQIVAKEDKVNEEEEEQYQQVEKEQEEEMEEDEKELEAERREISMEAVEDANAMSAAVHQGDEVAKEKKKEKKEKKEKKKKKRLLAASAPGELDDEASEMSEKKKKKSSKKKSKSKVLASEVEEEEDMSEMSEVSEGAKKKKKRKSKHSKLLTSDDITEDGEKKKKKSKHSKKHKHSGDDSASMDGAETRERSSTLGPESQETDDTSARKHRSQTLSHDGDSKDGSPARKFGDVARLARDESPAKSKRFSTSSLKKKLQKLSSITSKQTLAELKEGTPPKSPSRSPSGSPRKTRRHTKKKEKSSRGSRIVHTDGTKSPEEAAPASPAASPAVSLAENGEKPVTAEPLLPPTMRKMSRAEEMLESRVSASPTREDSWTADLLQAADVAAAPTGDAPPAPPPSAGQDDLAALTELLEAAEAPAMGSDDLSSLLLAADSVSLLDVESATVSEAKDAELVKEEAAEEEKEEAEVEMLTEPLYNQWDIVTKSNPTAEWAVIVDNGTYALKAGMAVRKGPTVMVPPVAARPKAGSRRSMLGPNSAVLLGKEAYNTAEMHLGLSSPLVGGVVEDWDDMQALWALVFREMQVDVAAEGHSLCITAPSQTNYQKLSEVAFEYFGVPALHVLPQESAALFSKRQWSGVSVNLGGHTSTISTVLYGGTVRHTRKRFGVHGASLTEYASTMLPWETHAASLATMNERNRLRLASYVKEQNFVVAAKDGRHPVEGARVPNRVLIDTTMDKRFAATLVPNDMAACTEAFFNPAPICGAGVGGLHQQIIDSVLACDPSLHRLLLGSVHVSGGSALFPGLGDRLEQQIKDALPSQLADVPVEVHLDASSAQFAAFEGCRTAAYSSLYPQQCASLEEYHEFGFSTVAGRFS